MKRTSNARATNNILGMLIKHSKDIEREASDLRQDIEALHRRIEKTHRGVGRLHLKIQQTHAKIRILRTREHVRTRMKKRLVG